MISPFYLDFGFWELRLSVLYWKWWGNRLCNFSNWTKVFCKSDDSNKIPRNLGSQKLQPNRAKIASFSSQFHRKKYFPSIMFSINIFSEIKYIFEKCVMRTKKTHKINKKCIFSNNRKWQNSRKTYEWKNWFRNILEFSFSSL